MDVSMKAKHPIISHSARCARGVACLRPGETEDRHALDEQHSERAAAALTMIPLNEMIDRAIEIFI
jgi:hypothetical protein